MQLVKDKLLVNYGQQTYVKRVIFAIPTQFCLPVIPPYFLVDVDLTWIIQILVD